MYKIYLMAQVNYKFLSNIYYWLLYTTYVFLFYHLERGKFLALDLGGTNFRVLLIELGENNYFHMDSEIFKVPTHIQTGKGTEVIKFYLICC